MPQQVEMVAYWRGVGFMLAGQYFAADMGEVAEILQPPKLTKVPGVRNWFGWLMRGRLVPVMDLAGLLGMPSKANGAAAGCWWLSKAIIWLVCW